MDPAQKFITRAEGIQLCMIGPVVVVKIHKLAQSSD